MVSKLDESVGKVVKALKDKNMLECSIIIFMSDNGAPTVGIWANTGSNQPFRGVSVFYKSISIFLFNINDNHFRL